MAGLFGEEGFGGSDVPEYNSDVLVQGGDGAIPTIGDSTDDATSENSPFDGVLKTLGSIGTVARDAGTAVGNIEKQFKDAGKNFDQARNNASTGNRLGTWWQYASETDKIMVILAIAGVGFAAYGVLKGK